MRTKLIRHGLAAAAVVGTIAVALVAAAHLPFVRARVFDWARTRAAQSFGILVDADAVGYNVLTASVVLRNPTLAIEREAPFFRADSLRLVFSRSVLWGTVRLERLDFVRPQIAIVRHADGTTNLPAGRTEPSSSGSAPLHLGLIDLRQLTVAIEDQSTGRALRAGPLDLTVDSTSANSAPGAFGPAAFSVGLSPDGGPAASGTLSGTVGGRLGFDGTRLSVPQLIVETPEGRLTTSGWVDLLAETLNVHAEGTLALSLARASRFIGEQASALRGSADARFTIDGTLFDPIVRTDISGRDVAYRSLAGAALSANAGYAGGRLTIDALDVTSPFGTVSIRGELPITSTPGSAGTGRILARIEEVQIDPLLDSSGISLPLQLGSTASGEFNLEAADPFGSDVLQRLSAQGTIRVGPLGAGASIGGQIDVDAAKAGWTITHALRSTTGKATLSGRVSGDIRSTSNRTDSTLSGRSQLRLDDLGAVKILLQQAGVDLPAAVRDRIAGSIDASIDAGGTVASPRALATISGRDIRVAELSSGTVDSTVRIDRQRVYAESLEARFEQMSLVASGDYTWQGQIDTRFAATADDLDALARATGAAGVSLSGAATLEGSVLGDVQSPRSRSTLTAQRLSVDGTPIGALRATLDLADWRVKVDARAPDLNAHVRGDVDTREPFAYRAEAVLNNTSIQALLPASHRSSIPIGDGAITADLRAQGVLRRPLESTGDVNLQNLNVFVSGMPVRLESPATVAAGPDLITATAIHLRAGTETQLRLRGALARAERRQGLEVHLDGSLSELLALAAGSISDWQLGADGRIAMDVRIGGTIRTPEPAGTISLRANAVRYADLPPLTDVALAAEVDREQISFTSVTATWQQAKLMAEGRVPLRMIVPESVASFPGDQKAAPVRARITNITPEVLSPFLEPTQLAQISGTAAINVTAEAAAFALEGIRAAVVVDEASFALAGVPFVQSEPTRLRLEGGAARIERLRWNAQGNELTVSGGANLAGPEPTVDLAIAGGIDLRILGAFVGDISPGGTASADVSVKGLATSPEITGSVKIAAGELRIDVPPLAASDFDGVVSVSADGMATVALKGLINGGNATITGDLSLKDWSDPRGRTVLVARNVTLDYPDGFQTESNADLTLTIAGPGSTLAGRIEVLNGTYREALALSRGLLTGITASDVVTTSTASSFLSNLRLDVAVASTDAVRIDNNYGRLDLAADLRVTGTAERPGAVGRIEALPDGEIYLLGNTYRVQDLVVDLANPMAIAPELTFLAETRVNNVPIELALKCTAAGICERDVRSQLTGVTNEQAEGMLFGNVADPAEAGAQLARLLSGELLGIVGQTVGLDTLRLEVGAAGRSDLFDDPSLLAGDVNPASRLTFGKRLGERVELAYSQDLAENGFTTSTSFFAPAGISLRALLLDDQSRSYEFRHEPRFGGQPQQRERQPPPPQPSIAAISIAGNPGFPEGELRGELRLTEGDRYDFATWQDDRARLKAWYRSRGFFEATVRARRLPAQAAGEIVLEYTIDRGGLTRLEVSGVTLPENVTSRIIDRWSGAIFDRFLERDVTLIVREHLYREGRLATKVDAAMQVDAADGARTLRIAVEQGPTLTPRLEFEGNAVITTSRLTEAAQGMGILAAWLDPDFFELAIERLYQEEGLLSAEVDVLEPDIHETVSVVRVVVREGEPWTIRRVTLGGADVLEDEGPPGSLAPVPGSRYDPKVISAHIADVERRFRAAGFLDVRVVAETVLDEPAHTADVHVLAAPGPRSVLASIAIEGASPDNPLITRTVNLAVGMPVDPAAVSDVRRSLYDTGVYRRVDIALEPAGGSDLPGAAADADRQVVARVRVEERQRYTFRYGVQLNDEVGAIDERTQRFGFSADLESRNVLGLGTTVGLSARLRRDQQTARVFVGANRFFGLPLRSNLFLSRGREEIGSGDVRTVSHLTEVSVEQTYRLRRFIDLRYGYGFGHNRTTFTGSDFDLRVKVARLTSSGIVDRRSDPFDPARGWFAAASFETSRPGLGSDISFLKSFQQYFHFVPVGKAVFASAVRVGLARTFRDEELIPSERFFAGGATSVRGYRQDDLGPRNVFNEAAGGRALFIGNGELRFPIYRWVKGIGFVDLGNVYETAGDLSLTNLQIGTGAGIRLDTPIGLLRLDLAAPANPRPFDSRWTAYVGLGHAF